MFLIVPKRAHPALGFANGHAAEAGPTALISTNARTQIACDGCRLRKTKCDGKRPCSKCRARQLVCVSSRSAQKVTGPVSADHLAVLQHQRQRLICATRRMAAIISELQADKHSSGASVMPLPDVASESCHDQGGDTDITEILNRYAPEPALSPTEEDRTTAQYSYKAKKRRREDLDPSDTDFPHEDDLEPCADNSSGSNSTDKAVRLGMNPAAAVVQDPTAPGGNAHVPFMRMLQNYNTSGVMTNGANANSLPAIVSGDPQQYPVLDSLAGTKDICGIQPADDGCDASFAAPDAPWDTSMASLLEMVDWDASIESCWGLYANAQDPPLGNGGWVEDETML